MEKSWKNRRGPSVFAVEGSFLAGSLLLARERLKESVEVYAQVASRFLPGLLSLALAKKHDNAVLYFQVSFV